jgi:hypothetical protein
MVREGKYIYCILDGNDGRHFGPIGIGQRGDLVTTIGYNDISAAISNAPLDQFVINRENLTAHELVIETVMQCHTVLPVRFCTIADNAEEIRGFLRKRYTEFRGLLKDLDNKVEIGLKARWTDMKAIFSAIAREDARVREMKARPRSADTDDEAYKLALGKAVQEALREKKQGEADRIVRGLARAVLDCRQNEPVGDDMFLNAAFLIDRTREKQFDFLLEDVSEPYGDLVDFTCVGPAPPFNFVNIAMNV